MAVHEELCNYLIEAKLATPEKVSPLQTMNTSMFRITAAGLGIYNYKDREQEGLIPILNLIKNETGELPKLTKEHCKALLGFLYKITHDS